VSDGLFEHEQVLGEVLNEREEAALGVVPRDAAEFLLVRTQAVHDAFYAELVVARLTVHRPIHRRPSPVSHSTTITDDTCQHQQPTSSHTSSGQHHSLLCLTCQHRIYVHDRQTTTVISWA